MYNRVRKDFYSPALDVDCYATVLNLPDCDRNRIKLRRHVGELTICTENAPFESVCIDILGELTRTKRGNRYVLVIVDRFTKLVGTITLTRISSRTVERALVTHWVFAYGPLNELIADNGRQFTSKFFLEVCCLLQIHNNFTTIYHSQTNGQVERFN